MGLIDKLKTKVMPYLLAGSMLLGTSLGVLNQKPAMAQSSIPYQQGWPVTLGTTSQDQINSSPTVVDLDKDGKLEVVVGSKNGNLYVIKHDGNFMQRWPVFTKGAITSSPAIADLDGDGDLEIVIGTFWNEVLAYHHDSTLVNGWPKETGGWVISSPAIADIDGDSKMEIFIGSDDGKVYAWHHDGSVVQGWPQQTNGWVRSSPAIADLDGDGKLEIIVGSDDGKVYVWHHDGSVVQGWPKQTGESVHSSPALADIDGDGKLEIVVGSYDDNVYAWHHDGTPVKGWPIYAQNSVVSSPAIADIDGDGKLEIVVGSYGTRAGNQVYALHHDGTLVSGWPVGAGDWVSSSPAVADIDGDGDLEVVIGSMDNKVYAWHHDGTPVTGFPLMTGGEIYLSSPAITDLDGDGDVEIIIGSWDGKVYAWDLPGKFDAAKTPWKMFRRDLMHTGSHHTFDDILTNYWSYHEIEAIYKAGITKGCVANNKEFIYCPSSRVRRDEMAAFLQRALKLDVSNPPATPSFSDIPKTYWDYAEIEAIYKARITKGCLENPLRYCPENNVRRDEMAAFLQRAKGLPLYNGSQIFSDIPLDYWDFGEIGAIYQEGITKGCLENPLRYCPENNVRRDEMAAFLYRAFLK